MTNRNRKDRYMYTGFKNEPPFLNRYNDGMKQCMILDITGNKPF